MIDTRPLKSCRRGMTFKSAAGRCADGLNNRAEVLYDLLCYKVRFLSRLGYEETLR